MPEMYGMEAIEILSGFLPYLGGAAVGLFLLLYLYGRWFYDGKGTRFRKEHRA